MSDSDEKVGSRFGVTVSSYVRDTYNQSPDLFDDSSNDIREDTEQTNMSQSLIKRRSKAHDMSDSESDSDNKKPNVSKANKNENKSDKLCKNGQDKTTVSRSPEKSARKQFLDNFLNMSDSSSADEDDNKAKLVKYRKVLSESKPASSTQKPYKKDYSKPMQKRPSVDTEKLTSRADRPTHKDACEPKSSPVPLKRKQSSSSPVPKELRKAVTEILMANENTSAKKKLPSCKYGSECYRKNPSHFEEYSHEKRVTAEKRKRSSSPPRKKRKSSSPSPEPGCSRNMTSAPPRSPKSFKATVGTPKSVSDKVCQAQPYSFFLTKVSGIADKYNSSLAMDIKDILSPDMGNLTASCQFNFMFDIPWLIKQYPPQFRSKPLLVVHGEKGPSKAALQADAMTFSNVRFCQATLEMMYGTHHTKMMLLLYDSGMRVVIHTSNLIANDWHQKTQGMWISPVFPRLSTPGKDKGDSPTHFKRDMLAYMAAYKAYQLKEWQEHIERHDMTAAKVVIIGSVPGRHAGDQNKSSWGHLRLRKCLQQHGPSQATVKSWPVIGQFSSIGSMGPNKDSWVCGEFLQSLSATKSGSGIQSSARMQLVFPSKDNVRLSLEGFPAGGSIPYSVNTAKKQTYLHDLFHVWKSAGRGRSGAMPHIKTYIRPKQDGTKAAWFLVTSANLSKAAWGALEKKGVQLMIRSYEIGVLLLPKFFEDAEVFDVTTDVEHARCTQTLALPYDLPVQAYDKKDRPWMYDIPYMDLPDTNGNVWCPFSK